MDRQGSGDRVDAHRLARILYWASLVMLLAGTWVLVDPLTRRPGERPQIYITLVAYEGYLWLLLLLGRWQVGKALLKDAARSGVFAAVLLGLEFMTVNELLMVSTAQGIAGAAMVLVLAGAKLTLGPRWLGMRLPLPLRGAALAWLAALAAPGVVLRPLMPDHPQQAHAAAFALSWAAALLVAGHLPLVFWQTRRGFISTYGALDRWWGPWVLVAILAGMALLQLPAAMWSLFVGWAWWYFSPAVLAGGAVIVVLGHASGRFARESWTILLACAVLAAAAWRDPAPSYLPAGPEGLLGGLWHPYYPGAVLGCGLLAVGGLVLKRWLVVAVAAAAPAAFVLAGGVRFLLTWPSGKGVALLLGAFALLGGGAWLQWWQVRERKRLEGPTPDGASPPPPAQEPPAGD